MYPLATLALDPSGKIALRDGARSSLTREFATPDFMSNHHD